MKVISSQTWCVTSTGERVPEGHPLARFLLVGKGCEIEDSQLEAYPTLEDVEEVESDDDVTEIIEGQPVKRPRGRPRKIPISE
jgi:hypothetical protein